MMDGNNGNSHDSLRGHTDSPQKEMGTVAHMTASGVTHTAHRKKWGQSLAKGKG